jgi:hypothetical protein
MPPALSTYWQNLFTLLRVLQKVSRTPSAARVTRSARKSLGHRPRIGLAGSVVTGPIRCAAGLLLFSIGGCASIGPDALDRDHLDYAQAVANAEMDQTLLNIVLRRYADPPTFLSINQVVASYTLQTSAGVTGGIDVTLPGRTGTLTGNAQYSQTPTMTFSPITGVY